MLEQGEHDNEMIASSMRIPKRVRDSLTRLAKVHKRSFNAELIWALEGYIESEQNGEQKKSERKKQR
jgi:hypothetical protein